MPETTTPAPQDSGLTRRQALGLFGVAGAAGAALPLLGGTPAVADTPALHIRPGTGGAPPVQGLHLTFGADPGREMVASWFTESPVGSPRVMYGTLDGGFGITAAAQTKSYVDGTSGRTVYVHHARMTRLHPDHDYVYAVQHDGAAPDFGTFRTAPRGRAPFTFTCFGDQAVPQTRWAPDGSSVPATLGAPASFDIVAGVEVVAPLFHVINGDLCYANINPDRLRIWNGFFTNNTRSARYRPWMPTGGNHEIEKLNGPIGFDAYQTYFALPGMQSDPELFGLWYGFTVGSVRVIVLENDDIALQDGGDYYVHGYSGGAQLRFLERELRAARSDDDIDWVVVAMHHPMISSADFNGAELSLRQAYGPLFDQYGVDLVLCGHEHHYERSLAVRGVVSGSATLTPNPASQATDVIDTGLGTVHMILGGGGNSVTSNQHIFPGRQAKVLTAVSAQPGPNGKRTPTYVMEDAVWQGVVDEAHPYGFAAFTVDPGTGPGSQTSLHVTYYNVDKPSGSLSVLEHFTLQRSRSDGH